MAVSGQDPLFHRPGSPAVFLQHPLVVVGLHNQGVHLPDALQGKLRRIAEVGQIADRALIRGEDKGCRVDRVMWYIKTLYLDILHHENATRGEQVPVRKSGQGSSAQRFRGERIRIDGNAKPATKDLQAGDMITVFMRDQDAVQTFRMHSDRLKPLPDLPGAKPGVDEKAALAGGD